MQRQIKRSIVIAGALAMAAAAGGAARGDDSVVTIQWNKPDTAMAMAPIEDKTLNTIYQALPDAAKQTCNTAATGDYAQNYLDVQRILRQLKAGDVLILNVHSSAIVVGAADASGSSLPDGLPWGRFWEFYGVKDPPRLALVITTGCMAGKTDGKDRAAEAPELEALRTDLNAEGLVSGHHKVEHDRAERELADLVTAMKNGDTPLAGDGRFDPATKVFGLTAPADVDRATVGLNELRKRARNKAKQVPVTVQKTLPPNMQAWSINVTIRSAGESKTVTDVVVVPNEDGLTDAEGQKKAELEKKNPGADIIIRIGKLLQNPADVPAAEKKDN